MNYELLCGDALTVLRTLPANSVHCCVTSPPYYGLRDYGTATWEGGDAECDHKPVGDVMRAVTRSSTLGGGKSNQEVAYTSRETFRDTCGKCGARRIDQQIGLEDTPEAYVARLVEVFREVRRVLHPSGVLFLNIGDSYAGGKTGRDDYGEADVLRRYEQYGGGRIKALEKGAHGVARKPPPGLKPKDLIGIPWMLAFALRADGWWLRSAITWCKGNPMPESVTDRCTSATEMVFMLAKSERYFYDSEAIKETSVDEESYKGRRQRNGGRMMGVDPKNYKFNGSVNEDGKLRYGQTYPTRNRRNWWVVNTEAYSGSHYAVMPTKLVEPCVLAGSSPKCCSKCLAPWERDIERMANYEKRQDRGQPNGKPPQVDSSGWRPATVTDNGWQPTCTCNAPVQPCTVLDPFFGSGTVGAVALKFGRRFVGIDLDARNLELAHKRIGQSQPMLLDVTA